MTERKIDRVSLLYYDPQAEIDALFREVFCGEDKPLLVDVTDGICRVCGCTDLRPCKGGCFWVEGDLCSRCAQMGHR